LGFLLLLGAACATTSTETQATSKTEKVAVAAANVQQQKKATRDPGDTVICEDDQVVGSHIPKLVCRTARAIEQNARDTQGYLQGPNGGCTNCSGQAIGGGK
jgi:hypothetical protein